MDLIKTIKLMYKKLSLLLKSDYVYVFFKFYIKILLNNTYCFTKLIFL